jgi:hypothetical protein
VLRLAGARTAGATAPAGLCLSEPANMGARRLRDAVASVRKPSRRACGALMLGSSDEVGEFDDGSETIGLARLVHRPTNFTHGFGQPDKDGASDDGVPDV